MDRIDRDFWKAMDKEVKKRNVYGVNLLVKKYRAIDMAVCQFYRAIDEKLADDIIGE